MHRTWSKTSAFDIIPRPGSAAQNAVAMYILAADAEVAREAGSRGHRGRREAMASNRKSSSQLLVVVTAVGAAVPRVASGFAVVDLGYVLDEGRPVS